MTKNKEAYTLNDGHIVEVIDRIHITLCHIDMSLRDHPLIDAFPEFLQKVEDADKILSGLYQDIAEFDCITDIPGKYEVKEGYKCYSKNAKFPKRRFPNRTQSSGGNSTQLIREDRDSRG